jgi:hypothetical protein
MNGHGLAVDQDLAGVGLVGTREHVHQGRLPRAVPAHERDDLTGIEIDAHAVDGLEPAEGHADVSHLDERCGTGFGRKRGALRVGHACPSLRVGPSG